MASFNDYDFPISFLFPLLWTEFPKTFLTVLPISICLTIIVTLNRFNVKGETLIMQAVGLGKPWFLLRATIFAIPWILVAGFITFVFVPQSNERTEELILKAESQLNVNFDKSNLKTFGENLMLSFNKTERGNQFEGLVVFIKQGKNFFLVSAKKGIYYEKNGLRWLGLSSVNMIQENSEQANLSYIEQFDVPLTSLIQSSLRGIYRNIRMQPATELWNNWQIPARGELYWRISWVVFMGLIPWIAVFLVSYRTDAGSFDNIFPAVLVNLVYYKALIFIRDYTEESLWSPEISYIILHAGSLAFIALLWRRENKLKLQRQ